MAELLAPEAAKWLCSVRLGVEVTSSRYAGSLGHLRDFNFPLLFHRVHLTLGCLGWPLEAWTERFASWTTIRTAGGHRFLVLDLGVGVLGVA